MIAFPIVGGFREEPKRRLGLRNVADEWLNKGRVAIGPVILAAQRPNVVGQQADRPRPIRNDCRSYIESAR